MGYSTSFTGRLEFGADLSAQELELLSNILGQCGDDLPLPPGKTDSDYPGLGYIQYEITKDFKGIAWDCGEKFYGAVASVNFIIDSMKALNPGFELKGELFAQGEEFDDRWILRIVDGRAAEIPVEIKGEKVTCPHCDEEFVIEEEK